MLKHIVFMKFKPGVQESEIADMERGLAALPGKINEIREYVFGRDIIRSERSCDFALVSAFDDMEALQRYQVHPDHQAVVARVKAVSDSILAVDFTY